VALNNLPELGLRITTVELEAVSRTQDHRASASFILHPASQQSVEPKVHRQYRRFDAKRIFYVVTELDRPATGSGAPPRKPRDPALDSDPPQPQVRSRPQPLARSPWFAMDAICDTDAHSCVVERFAE
jgi:hypothetical protein